MEDKRKESPEAVKKRVASVKERKKALGLIRVEVWVKPEEAETVRAFDRSGEIEKNKPGRKT